LLATMNGSLIDEAHGGDLDHRTETAAGSEDVIRLAIARTWWANPAWIVVVWAPVGPVVAWLTTPNSFLVFWRSTKYFTTTDLITSLTYIVVLAFSLALAGASRGRVRPELLVSRRQLVLLANALRWFFGLTIFGYVAWIGVGVVHGVSPAAVVSAVSGDPGALHTLKTEIHPVAGLTSFTQFGPLVTVLAGLLKRLDRQGRYMRYAWPIIILAIARSFIYAERLAAFEVLAPLLLSYGLFARTDEKPRPIGRAWRRAAPFFAPLLLIVVFGVFEYDRSWSNYYKNNYDGSYASFTATRLTGYYATSSNNSALIEAQLSPELSLPYYTTQMLWTFPVISHYVSYQSITGIDPDTAYTDVLTNYDNPEFNNPGGLLEPEFDYGRIGGAIFWVLAGIIFGRIWLSIKRGSLVGVIWLGITYVSFLELDRFVYFSLGRFFPAAIGALVLTYKLRQLRTADTS
jgi:hypothetical protein